jgi:hypothetical protein
LAPLGEEAEGEEEGEDQAGAQRERELANQKARIVSEMATLRKLNGQADSDGASASGKEDADRRDEDYRREPMPVKAELQSRPRYAKQSPRRPLTAASHTNQAPISRHGASPLKHEAGTPVKPKRTQETRDDLPDPKLGLSDATGRTRQSKPVGLFEVVQQRLSEGLEAAETPEGYLPEGEQRYRMEQEPGRALKTDDV